MLTMVEVINDRGENLALPIEDYASGYLVKDVEGLDPVRATITSSKFALLPGEQYQASRRGMRNILLKLGYQPDYGLTSVSELRNKLYNFLMPETEVTLAFYIDGEEFVTIKGRVESFETALFSKDPEVTVSILCFDPDFQDVNVTVVTGATTEGLVEYETDYKSVMPTGGIFRMTLSRSLGAFELYNRTPSGETQSMEITHPFLSGDVVEIDSMPGGKRVTRIRSGVSTSILYAIPPNTRWIMLQPGVNNLRVFAGGASIPFTFAYRTRYGGL